jgi:hypothetical protein
MGEEESQIDVAEANGKATATFCLLGALIIMLAKKGVITADEAAELTGQASAGLKAMPELPEDVQFLADSCLRGLAKSLTRTLAKH